MKKILFVCGTGGSTSAVAENYVVEACKKEGLSVRTIRCSPTEVRSNLDDIDLIVTTTFLSGNFPVPLIHGLALITGIGKEKVIDDILQSVKEAR